MKKYQFLYSATLTGQNQKTLLLFVFRRHIVLKILKLDGRVNGVVNVTLVMVIVKVLVLV
jgi:hypothetical protein